MKKLIPWALTVSCIFVQTSSIYADSTQPKYGPKEAPKATPLPLSNSYFRDPNHPATGFWALISYYIPQSTHASCSSATLTMALNAARSDRKEGADDQIITEQMLMDRVRVEHWKERLNKGGYLGQYGANLDQMGKISEAAFKSHGFPKVSVKTVHFNNQSPALKKDLVEALKSISSKKFLLANFNQQKFTDDTDVGHFAPVGAYDDTRNQVLILDPDREYYVPYWVSLDVFMEGMSTRDSGSQLNRGYLLINAQ